MYIFVDGTDSSHPVTIRRRKGIKIIIKRVLERILDRTLGFSFCYLLEVRVRENENVSAFYQ